ncbi:uncharacterized protein LOC128228465 [Mya arenaria]|uniref:uncharacterized protein LOC128228465 n=1 Tax=Mya arenaria TaxID=6604 RepID=UPI0022E7D9B2|nr:uncharacterized protein LOC128228465 [Mya arenaria]
MRAFVFLSAVLAVTYAAPSKSAQQTRFLLNDCKPFDAVCNLQHVFNLTQLKAELQVALDVIGSDPTEQACEQELHKIAGNALLDYGVPLACHSFQTLISHLHLTPDTTAAPARRFLLDLHVVIDAIARALGVNVDHLHEIVQQLVNVLGSDPTEQLCEQEMHALFSGALIDHGVPLFCGSFQTLVSHFGVSPTA